MSVKATGAGPTTLRTYTFPDYDASVLTSVTDIRPYTIGDLMYASGTTSLAKLAGVAVGQVLVSGGVGVAPAWSATPVLTSLTLSGNLLSSGSTSDLGSTGNPFRFLYLLGSGSGALRFGVAGSPQAYASGTTLVLDTPLVSAVTALQVGATPATTGTVRLPHGGTLTGRESTNAVDRILIDWGAATTDKLLLGHVSHRLQLIGSDIEWMKALVALGGGAAPTLGTIGGAGPTTAGQNSWMRVVDSAGNAFWVPAWK